MPYQELRLQLKQGSEREVGIRMTLSFFDRNPAIQVTLTDLTTRAQLSREQTRASLAEEANARLLEEIERHRATQRRLHDAERLNRSIVESSIDMIVAFDVHGQLMQWNQAASVEFGWTFEEAKQLTFRVFWRTNQMPNASSKNCRTGTISQEKYRAFGRPGRPSPC